MVGRSNSFGLGVAPRPLLDPSAMRNPGRIASPGLQAHFRAARVATPTPACRQPCGRPQLGTGCPPASGHDDTLAGLVSHLMRVKDRGELPSLPLLLECMQSIGDLDVSSTAGDGRIWMIAPVLKAARDQLLQGSGDRQVLEVQSSNLKSRAEDLLAEADEIEEGQLSREESFHQQASRQRLEIQ
ncbi:unnamed protein product, partial [Polarella glacialis]